VSPLNTSQKERMSLTLDAMLTSYSLGYILQCEGLHFWFASLSCLVAFLGMYQISTTYWGSHAQRIYWPAFLLSLGVALPLGPVSHYIIDGCTGLA
jgi:hypothetical protein